MTVRHYRLFNRRGNDSPKFSIRMICTPFFFGLRSLRKENEFIHFKYIGQTVKWVNNLTGCRYIPVLYFSTSTSLYKRFKFRIERIIGANRYNYIWHSFCHITMRHSLQCREGILNRILMMAIRYFI